MPNNVSIEGTWEAISSSEQFDIICIFLFILVAFWLRKTPLGFLWKLVVSFFVVLFATIFINYAKKEIKEWWKK